ncbi:MAG: hypothetical protein LPD71_05125 [Shewanella sp.]|nr:hypothetical protein [Shewanella sp.]MCF1438142.1 hypothetical protein [Shewanella sp.]MCF1459110.1 hypothetical protein [Shewanella sp.]
MIIWLLFSWISLVLLAPAHSLSHIPDGSGGTLPHCSLCVHKLHMATGIPAPGEELPPAQPQFVVFTAEVVASLTAAFTWYFSRGPPLLSNTL